MIGFQIMTVPITFILTTTSHLYSGLFLIYFSQTLVVTFIITHSNYNNFVSNIIQILMYILEGFYKSFSFFP